MHRCGGHTAHYAWTETVNELEVRLPVPIGTKRSQLQISLHDGASGINLWRTEVETVGGATDNHTKHTMLSVRPVFWPEPLIDGSLCGVVDARESSYQLVAASGGDAWDLLIVSLRKADQTDDGWWGGVVHGEAADGTHSNPAVAGSTGLDTLPCDTARLVQLLAASLNDDGVVTTRCAMALASRAEAGRSSELFACNAFGQLSAAMRDHPALAELQAAGCAVLARAPVSADAPTATTDVMFASQLLDVSVAAVLRHPASELVQLHGARALLAVAIGSEVLASALLNAEGGALLASMLQQPAPVCDAACAALAALARQGPKAQAGLVHQGAAAAVVCAAASGKRGLSWRRQCASVIVRLAECADVSLLRVLLASGLISALVSLCGCAEADQATQVLAAHALGALSWRGVSKELRQPVKEQLISAKAASALIGAAEAYPRCAALRVACLRVLAAVTALGHVEEKLLTPEQEERLRVGELAARKPTPAVPIPKPPRRKLTNEENASDAEFEEAVGAAASTAARGASGRGLSEVHRADGVVNISEEDALDTVRRANAAAAIKVATAEAHATIDDEVRFLLRFIEHENTREGDDADTTAAAAAPAFSIAATPVADAADAPTNFGGATSCSVLVARMQVSADVAAALALSQPVDMKRIKLAASLLSGEAARAHAQGLAFTVLHQLAAKGELHRAALLRHRAVPVVMAALPANSRHGDRQAQLCATLAQLSCALAYPH